MSPCMYIYIGLHFMIFEMLMLGFNCICLFFVYVYGPIGLFVLEGYTVNHNMAIILLSLFLGVHSSSLPPLWAVTPSFQYAPL